MTRTFKKKVIPNVIKKDGKYWEVDLEKQFLMQRGFVDAGYGIIDLNSDPWYEDKEGTKGQIEIDPIAPMYCVPFVRRDTFHTKDIRFIPLIRYTNGGVVMNSEIKVDKNDIKEQLRYVKRILISV